MATDMPDVDEERRSIFAARHKVRELCGLVSMKKNELKEAKAALEVATDELLTIIDDLENPPKPESLPLFDQPRGEASIAIIDALWRSLRKRRRL